MPGSWEVTIDGQSHDVELLLPPRWTPRSPGFRCDGRTYRFPHFYYYCEVRFEIDGHPAIVTSGARRPSMREMLKRFGRRRLVIRLTGLLLLGMSGERLEAEAGGMLVGSELAPPASPVQYELIVDGSSYGIVSSVF